MTSPKCWERYYHFLVLMYVDSRLRHAEIDSSKSATVVTIILCALLPPSRPRLYLPVLFQLGEAFNSHIVWLYILDRLAEVTESQVALNSSTAEYKDIGLFTRTEWELIINRSLSE